MGRKALVKAICERQLVFIIYWQVLKSVFLNSSLIDKPPLLIKISILSTSFCSWAYFRHSSGLLKSICIIFTLEGSLHSLLTLSSSDKVLAAITTVFALSSKNLFASYSPIPLLPPVMRITFPEKSNLQVIHLKYLYPLYRMVKIMIKSTSVLIFLVLKKYIYYY